MNPTDENNWTVIAKKSKKGKMSLDPKKKLPTSKEPQPSIITEEMAIEPDLMGHLAGHMGTWSVSKRSTESISAYPLEEALGLP